MSDSQTTQRDSAAQVAATPEELADAREKAAAWRVRLGIDHRAPHWRDAWRLARAVPAVRVKVLSDCPARQAGMIISHRLVSETDWRATIILSGLLRPAAQAAVLAHELGHYFCPADSDARLKAAGYACGSPEHLRQLWRESPRLEEIAEEFGRALLGAEFMDRMRAELTRL